MRELIDNFSTRDLTPETNSLLEKSIKHMQKVSDRLYAENCPCDYNKAIEYLEGINLFDEF